MLHLDHLTLIAPSLQAGADHVKQQLGIDVPAGGQHPQMGTHNLLLRLGDDVFLEVIAIDPQAASPGRARWFGLDHEDAIRSRWNEGYRLNGWVARADDLDTTLLRHGDTLGKKERVSRGDRVWSFAVPVDGALPCGGAAPSVMDWGPRGNPAPVMLDLGARLVSFVLEHPEPERIRQLYKDLEIRNPPEVRQGARLRYRAMIATPDGLKELA